MATHEFRSPLEPLAQDSDIWQLRDALEQDLHNRAQIARNAIDNIQRFLSRDSSPPPVDIAKLMISALGEITEDPVKAYYGPGHERILARLKSDLRGVLEKVRLYALGSSKDALALAYTYEACELYREAGDLYQYILVKMDEKMDLAREGSERVFQKLRAHQAIADGFEEAEHKT